ncbi:hypothetical protein CKF43_08375 [Pantoea graminicola]|nr:hypothetical protein CKF43_08375 [Pantoea sp. ARC607]
MSVNAAAAGRRPPGRFQPATPRSGQTHSLIANSLNMPAGLKSLQAGTGSKRIRIARPQERGNENQCPQQTLHKKNPSKRTGVWYLQTSRQ